MEQNKDIGDKLRDLVYKRLDIKRAADMKCPREKSYMTPCVARDGSIAMTDLNYCVGCMAYVPELLQTELDKQPDNENRTEV